MNVVIVGSGRTGAFLASLLDQDGNVVSIVDLDRAAFKRLPSDFKGTPVLGDGTDMDILRQAGVESANAFLADWFHDVTRAISRARDATSAASVSSISPSSSIVQISGPSHGGSWSTVLAWMPFAHNATGPLAWTHSPGFPASGSGQRQLVNGDRPSINTL